jgi:serine/threonine-protein phosphatase 5
MYVHPLIRGQGIRSACALRTAVRFGLLLQSFLADNGLRLIIRSHEGPDARDKRQEGDRMPSVDSGYAVDHDTPSEYAWQYGDQRAKVHRT